LIEIWKDIPGFEGRYQASTLGRIRTIKHKVTGRNPYTKKAFQRTVPERILKPGRFCKSGHISVVLGRGSNSSPVHQLVMRTFVGEPPEKMEVLHINGNPIDNRLENLKYGTRTENILDTYKYGGRWKKLSTEDVLAIRKALKEGDTGKELADKYGVCETSISNIRNGRTFSWLK